MRKFIVFVLITIAITIILFSQGVFKKNEQVLTWNVDLIGTNKNLGEGVKIAIIDSGINTKHEDLKKVVTKKYNVINPNNEIIDEFGHGTAIAGIIAAQNNRVGIIGIAPNVEVFDVKVLDEAGFGEVDDLIEALDWSMKNNVDIINISFGFQTNDADLKRKINDVIKSGIIIVAAAGNTYGLKGDYPAMYDGVLSIGSLDKEKKRSNFTSKGNIDFVSPGEDILSTDHNGSYSYFSGTSFASSHVTGLIALLLSENIDSNFSEDIIFSEEEWTKKSHGNGLLTLRKEDIINEY